jgi:hypothetical protein
MYLIRHIVKDEHLHDLLKDGYIRPSAQTKKTFFCGEDTSNYIYLSLFSKKVKPVEFGYPIYLSSDILNDMDAYYIPDWRYVTGPLKELEHSKRLKKNDLPKIEKDILKNIKQYTKRTKLNKIFAVLHSHQILIKKKINLKKYIVCIPKINKYLTNMSKMYITKTQNIINDKYLKYEYKKCSTIR